MRSRWLLSVAMGLPVAAVGALTLAVASYDGRGDLLLADVAGADQWNRELVPDAREATEELCDEELPCVEALTSRTLTMYRFAERHQAAAAAESFGEHGYLTGWIAVRYEPEGLTPAQRRDFERGIGCVDTSVADGGAC